MRCVYVLIAMIALPLAARGTLLPDGGVSAPEVAAALHTAGYPADSTAERTGSPMIRSSTGKILFFVHFFQCDAQLRCASIQFTTALHHKTVAPATVAAWNRERRFGRAFLDNHGTAWIAMDVETGHGITTEALAANIERWVSVIGTFETFADRKEAALSTATDVANVIEWAMDR
ncbi:MAG: YbjN domain-containing protein [Acetobacteraceae bacterium]|jgi:hypothetical protein